MGEEQAILDAVADFLEPGGYARSGAGPIRAYGDLQGSVDATGFIELKEETSITALRVITSTQTDAVVDLDAVRQYRGRDRYGRVITGSTRYTGPAALVREDGGWKVADVLRDGQSVRSSVISGGISGTLPNVEVEALGGIWLGNQVSMIVEVRNDLGRALRMKEGFVGFSTPDGRLRWRVAFFATAELAQGTSRIVVQGPPATDQSERRLLFDTDQGLIDVRSAQTPPQRRIPIWLGLRPTISRFLRTTFLYDATTAVVLAAMFGLLFGPQLGGFFWMAGLAFVFFSSLSLAQLQIRRLVSSGGPRRIWVAWSLGVAAIAVALVLSQGGPGRLHGFFDVMKSWWGLGVLLCASALYVAIGSVSRYRRGDHDVARKWLIAATVLAVPGLVLMGTHGGFWPSTGPREQVISIVKQRLPHQKFVSASSVSVRHRGPCTYDVWAVRTSQGRWWVITNINTGLDDIYPEAEVNSAAEAVHAYAFQDLTTAQRISASSC